MIDEILIWIFFDIFMYVFYVLSKYIISNNIEFVIDLFNIKSLDMVKVVKKFREFRERERERKMIKMYCVVNVIKLLYKVICLLVIEIF